MKTINSSIFTLSRGRHAVMVAAALLAAVAAGLGIAAAREDAAMQPSAPRRKGLAVFVVDSSASMRIRDAGPGEPPASRLDASRDEVIATIEGLMMKGEFLFDIVLCSSEIRTLSGSLGLEGPLKMDEYGAQEAKSFLAGSMAAGMTRLFDAIQEGMEICSRAPPSFAPGTLMVFTDGVPSYPHTGARPDNTEEFIAEVRAANRGGVRINAHAVCATSEGIAFLETLCAENRGMLFVRRPAPRS